MSIVPQLRLSTDAGAAFPFQGMTFPFYRRLLECPDTATVAVGASLAEGPVGLALAEVAGWMITHRSDVLTVRYTTLWVRPDLPVKGVGIRMLVEALRRHIAGERQIPGAQACFGTFPDFRLAGFIERRLLPFLPDAKVRTTMESEKDFP